MSGGACGYGTLTTAQYPGLDLAGVSLSKSILGKYSLKGCGSCLEVRCTDKEVRLCGSCKTHYEEGLAAVMLWSTRKAAHQQPVGVLSGTSLHVHFESTCWQTAVLVC